MGLGRRMEKKKARGKRQKPGREETMPKAAMVQVDFQGRKGAGATNNVEMAVAVAAQGG